MSPGIWLPIIFVPICLLLVKLNRQNAASNRVPSSKSTNASQCWRSKVRKVNESLFEMGEPPSSPTMVVLFFHGLYSREAMDMHLCTWESEDGSSLWPNTWLSQKFPGARILYVSYDGSLTGLEGKLDMHLVGENLGSDLMQEGIGQADNCPVIMVGYCFGGLVIKQLCLHINQNTSLATCEKRKLKKFLHNIKGVFYYGTPHRGSAFVDEDQDGKNNPLLQYFKTLSKETSRSNSNFAKLCKAKDWRTRGLGESIPTKMGLFKGVVAPEASARDGERFNILQCDHMSICRPQSITDMRCYALIELLDDIVDNLKVVVSGHQVHGLPKYPMELERRAEKLQRKLLGGGVLGIYGMGGIGKTTLAKRVYNNISTEFAYTCFVDNVKYIPSHELGHRVLTHFHHSGKSSDQNQVQWADLEGKKTLIVMDDVDSMKQLEVLPELQYFGDGSCFILTSRNEATSRVYENSFIYRTDFLQKEAALKLFCHHAFGQEAIPSCLGGRNHLVENVEKVVMKCGGLPLTLEVIGSYLRGYDNNPHMWTATIEKLSKAQSIDGDENDILWARLKVSYDGLGEEEKHMFIEAATYFFEQPLDLTVAALGSEATWRNLEGRSMVKIFLRRKFNHNFLEVVDHAEVWVHEQLRDLAKKLSKGVTICGEDELANKAVAEINESQDDQEETRGLRLSYKSLKLRYGKWGPRILEVDRTELQAPALAKLKKLKYLDLDGVVHDGLGKYETSKISLLRWHAPSENSVFPIDLNNNDTVAVLDLHDCCVPEGFCEALGNLPNLRVLSLARLAGQPLRVPEKFVSFSQLRRLELGGFEQLTFPPSFGNLPALESLKLWRIKCLSLPMSFEDMSSLVKLSIAYCDDLVRFPSSSGHGLKSLKELFVNDCPLLECLPPFSQASGLQRLTVLRCEGVKELEDSFGNLCELENVHLLGLSIKILPHSFGQLSALKTLRIEECACLKELGDSFANLSGLQDLVIWNTGIRKFPDNFGELRALQIVEIYDSNYMCEIPDSYGDEEIPYSFGFPLRFPSSLTDLRIYFSSVQFFPESLNDLAGLKKLVIRGNQVKTLPESLGLLSSLEHLDIRAQRLNSLPVSFGGLSSLQEVSINSDELKSLPQSFGELAQLEKLELRARSLETIPASVGNLSSLCSWTLDTPSLKQLPEALGQLSQMQQLILRCPHLKELPDSLGNLSSLEKLEIRAKRIERLPESLGSLSSLETLKIRAKRIATLPEDLRQLHSLRKLTLHVGRLKSLPESIGQLPSLRVLKLEGDNTRILAEDLGSFPSLEDLTLEFRQFEDLLDLEKLPSLRKLEIRSLCMECVPESFWRISSLTELRLRDCAMLNSLTDNLGGPSPPLLDLRGKEKEREDELERLAKDPASKKTTAAEGLRLGVCKCPCLGDLKSFSWVMQEESGGRDSWHWFRREGTTPGT